MIFCRTLLYRSLALGAIALLTSASAQAAETTPYEVMGAPVDPQVNAAWNVYHDHAAATKLLRALVKAHPQHAKLNSVGKSYGGRDLWILTITNFDQSEEAAKPGFWIDGGIHANEIQTVEVALYTAWYLLESYAHNPVIKQLVDDRVFYIAPMLSPDARDMHLHEPATTHSPRSGLRPVDDDHDGLVDEDGPDDLDGDGSITQMRIKDPLGRWKPHDNYPQWMERVEPGEVGAYTLLGQEGIDNDGDGAVNEDGPGYYDPNRNWGWNWQPDYVQNGAHHYPFSILEDRMLSKFIIAHPNIAGAQTFHNSGGMILRGPGAKDDRYSDTDIAVYTSLAREGEKLLPAYRYMDIANDLYEVYGGEMDWFHGVRGVYAFTVEMFPPYNLFHQQQTSYFGGDEELHRFNKFLLFGQGFSDWKEFDHPKYGKIEIGGWKKNWVRQPPAFLLQEESHRAMAFALYHASELPRVRLELTQVKAVSDSLYEVTVSVHNDGVTPTHADVDVRQKITRPDYVTLSGKNVKVIAGLQSGEPFFEDGIEQRRRPERQEIATIPGHGLRYVRWYVEGSGPVEATIDSVKGGRATQILELKPAAKN